MASKTWLFYFRLIQTLIAQQIIIQNSMSETYVDNHAPGTENAVQNQPTLQAPTRIQLAPAESVSDSDIGKGMGLTFGILFAVFACFNLAFIVPDLVYAYQKTECVETVMDGISFPLRIWLEVDAYMRIAMTSLLLFVAIGACVSYSLGVRLFICVIVLMIVYSIFSLAWTIVGSVLFWGKLNPAGHCSGGVQAYMYALLIITYVATCCNCLYNLNNGKNR